MVTEVIILEPPPNNSQVFLRHLHKRPKSSIFSSPNIPRNLGPKAQRRHETQHEKPTRDPSLSGLGDVVHIVTTPNLTTDTSPPISSIATRSSAWPGGFPSVVSFFPPSIRPSSMISNLSWSFPPTPSTLKPSSSSSSSRCHSSRTAAKNSRMPPEANYSRGLVKCDGIRAYRSCARDIDLCVETSACHAGWHERTRKLESTMCRWPFFRTLS